jgi:hypothetical protein
VAELLKLAEQADAADVPDGMSIPEELERREARLAAIAEAKRKIEARVARARAGRVRGQAASARREGEADRQKAGGRPPAPPSGKVDDKEQINLTDEESRIMPVAGGGFEQCYNAQAAVAAGSMLVVAHDVTQAANDKQQLVPIVDQAPGVAGTLGRVEDPAGRQRLSERGQCEPLRGGRDRAFDHARA